MSQDLIRYDLLAQEALRGVIRSVLADAARNGLPGEHHFYIAIDTVAPGVRISNRLRERYPEEMTVVIQHQFWDLEISDTAFSVSLSFNGVPERLVIPFAAIKGFFDPSVQFGLQFEPMGQDGEESGEADADDSVADAESDHQSDEPSGDDTEPVTQDDDESGTADVVSLDQFRKKN